MQMQVLLSQVSIPLIMASIGDIRNLVLDVVKLIKYAGGVYRAAEERAALLAQTDDLHPNLQDLEDTWRYFGSEDKPN
ncbi:uncharacterized protein PG986_004582 [Apiospora aurea]|uniref:Uncharacterized protein n=1 Tax=Apiospora aurea TaxID=335848 RepID=A0ABR1QN00_9PEZI